MVRSYPCGGVFVFVDAAELDGESEATVLSKSTLSPAPPAGPAAEASEGDVGVSAAGTAAGSSLALLALPSPLLFWCCLRTEISLVVLVLVPFRQGNGTLSFVGRARSLTDRSRDAVRRQ